MNAMTKLAVAVLALSTAAAVRADSNVAAGKGQLAEGAEFAPHHAYAYSSGEGDKKRLFVVLTEVDPPRAAWDDAGDRTEARAAWCRSSKQAFVALEIKPSGEVDMVRKCDRAGMTRMEMVNVMNGLPSVAVKLETNDGKRAKGSIETGDGACGNNDEPPKYCTATGSYTFDATLAPPTLVDRIWTTGKTDAPELAAATKALQAYWDAAGKAAAIGDLSAHFSAERAAQVDAQKGDAMAERLFKNLFVPAHQASLTIVGGRVLGAAAVVDTTSSVTRGDKPGTQTCRTLLRNESGAWKIDKESCKL
jgi:hypothetical protein